MLKSARLARIVDALQYPGSFRDIRIVLNKYGDTRVSSSAPSSRLVRELAPSAAIEVLNA
jgi:hypothetical protein